MHRLLALALIFVAAGSARADRYDPIAASLGALRTAAKCDDKASPWRPWCIAVDYYSGKPADLPTKNLVGLTIELENGVDVAKALSDKVTLVSFAATRDGKLVKVKLADIKPTNDDEIKSVAEGVMAVSLVFKGKAKVAELPKELASYVAGLTGSYEVTKGPLEWSWTGKNPSTARKVGAFWVVIEIASKGNGIWATILTDQWAKK
jgi:hypothetical protein